MTLIGIAILIIIGGLLLGMYIQYAFLAAALFLVATLGYKTSFLLTYGYGVVNSLVLLCVPLFIAVGSLMNQSGIGKSLVEFVDIFVGRVKCGLAVVAVVASAAFGSIAGSSLATLSCIGSIMKPRFEEAGYDKSFSAALVTCAAPLGLLIPPSAHMVLYSWSGRQSLLACFLATVGPGLLLVLLLSITSYFILRKNSNIKNREKMSYSEFIKMTRDRTASAAPALAMPFIVLGGIYSGYFTPTEAAAVAVIYTIPVGFFVYKKLTVRSLYKTLKETASSTGVIMVMIFCIMMLSRIYIMEDLPGMITDALKNLSDNKYVILLGTNIILLIIGMIMDDTSAILLCSPIFIPILQNFGVDPIHFAAIIGVNIGIGLLSPPTAPCLYFGAGVMKVRVADMLPTTMKFLIFAWIPTLLAVTYFPQLALWLPNYVIGRM
ncbi:MAG: TRAP transporter large permease [Synergistes jonesii]|uniref:TRAP transporter large permease n=1 Tax=Synergistes jonesii TaxID=2754 RepID=UPI002A75DC27|nr:TRAP transporter large permease [Synergistes jonesii]MDY2984915.1 TRAP transporter large permease [Synergistes jonesii]